MLYLKHTTNLPVLSYFTSPNKYFNDEKIEGFDFITLDIPIRHISGLKKGVYIIPIIKKKCEEMFGEEVGDQAESLATQFMEKLSQDWEQRHGKIKDDGLSIDRLKELLGNVKSKVEGMGGDITTDGGHTIQNNIMSAEDEMAEQHGALPGAVKVQPKYPKPEKNPHPVGSDAMKQGEVVKSLDKSKSFFGQTSEELDDIRKLSGLEK
jgi:hypothetical protein